MTEGGRYAGVDLEPLLRDLRQFVADRDWAQFHTAKNLTMAIVSEAGELVAEYRWLTVEESESLVHDPSARQRVAAEVADVAITLLLFCERTGIDILDAIGTKLRANAERYPTESSRGIAGRPPRAIKSEGPIEDKRNR